MLRPRSYAAALLAATAILLPAAPSPAQHNRAKTLPAPPALRGTLTAGGVRYAVGNPEMVVGPGVSEVLVSPDGRLVLASRVTRELTSAAAAPGGRSDDAPGEATVVSWNARTGRLRTVWSRPLAPRQGLLFRLRGWMGRSNTAVGYAPKSGGGQLFLLIDAALGRTREVPVPPDTYTFVGPSPALPFAALFGADGAADKEVRFLRPDGTITAPAPLPGTVFFSRWSPDGKELRGVHVGDGQKETWYAVDPTRLSTRAIPEPPKNAKGQTDYGDADSFTATDLPLRLEGDGEPGKPGRVWLRATEGAGAPMLLAAEGEPVGLLPDGSAALYRSAGALYAARIVAAPPTAPRPSP